MGFSLRSLFALSVILLALTCAAEDDVPGLDGNTDANSIVQAALRAEVNGDAPRREALLAGALQREPKHLAARWHSGYVRINDSWMTVEQAEQSTTEKGAAAAYRNLRDRQSGTLAGELSLARWCRKHGMEERERLHWANLLRLDPNNKEARGRLGLREFRGQLLTVEQIEDWKQGMQKYQRALKEWDSTLSRWRREIESSPTPRRTEAWRQLLSLYDPEAVPSLEKMFPKVDLDLQLDIVSALGNIEDQIATDALVRLALNARSSEIREAAATELSDRSWFGFVPNLLCRLESPVECRYAMNTLGDGVLSEIRFSQENQSAVVNVSRSVNAQFPVTVVNKTPDVLVRASIRQQKSIAQEASRQYRRILESLHAVQTKNTQSNMFNQRVYAALGTSTGQQIESRPRYWWDWWKDYNELDNSEEKPQLDFRYRQRYRRPIVFGSMSCFLAGTLVWTETGPVAIEDVRPGDRVLSQDPESGELTHQIVLGTTIRPPSPTLRIQFADEQIEATLGHPIWVVGHGWRMAKELNAGDQLHGVGGGITIDNIEPGPISQAYNLVVAETNTYFVGKHRVLVHDNMPRRAMDLPVPGWATETY